MKKVNWLFLIFSLSCLSCSLSFSSCSKEKEEPDTPSDDIITLDKIVGVWEFNDYFISFNGDKFCTSFVAPGFIDSGNFQFVDGVVYCLNSYFNHTTTYIIKSVQDSKMNVEVQYSDFRGESKKVSLYLSKKNEIPVEKDNPLVGKSYNIYSSTFGTITNSFMTYCSGQKTASSGSAKKYPLNIFYIWRDGKSYHQLFTNKSQQQTPTIGSSTTNADDGNIYIKRFVFSTGGGIEDVENIDTIVYDR